MEKKLFYFISVKFGRMETLITTKESVNHMARDLRSGHLMFADGSSLRITDGQNITTLVGSPTETGYREGVGTEVRFDYIKGFTQVNESMVIASDYFNDCLRKIDLNSLLTTAFAGNCTSSGDQDGWEDALFNGPSSILLDSSSKGLFVLDNINEAIRYINLTTNKVSTLLNKDLSNPSGIAYDITLRNLLISNEQTIIMFSLENYTTEVVAGAETTPYSNLFSLDDAFSEFDFLKNSLVALEFKSPAEILVLNENITLVADEGGHVIRVLDMESGFASSICTGSLGLSDGYADNCELLYPSSLLLLDRILYVGQTGAIRTIAGKTNH